MDTNRSARTAALICVIGTGLAVLYAAGIALTAWEPSYGFALQAVIHVAELAGVVALLRSGAAGPGWLARIGLGAAVVGEVLLVVAELVYTGDPDLGNQLFGVGPLLSALGMVAAGVAVLRVGRWTGWHRFTPLVVGLWSIVVLTPAIIVSGGPPAPVALWAIAGWELTWLLLGVSVWVAAGRAASRRAESRAAR
jgi:hypothetical protein